MRECAASDGTMALTELNDVSARIKELRARTDLKQHEAAYKLRVAPRTYQSWENGEVETSRKNYAKIGKLFGASVNWILFGQEDEPALPTATTEPQVQDQLRELLAGQLELTARVARVERLLEDQQTQKRPSAPRRKGTGKR
jgi:DNA-binding XRE family transcriptional regulator